MNDRPLVSSIIIFFNAERFFEEAIESVFAQTYENWELILADDGSTDGSTALARGYADRYPEKVRYLEHEGHQNRGMSATRNLGIRHARGEYIAFLDSDDVWLPNKLERQVTLARSNPSAALIYGKSLYWESWTGAPEDSQRDSIPDSYVPADTLYSPPALLLLCYPLGEALPPGPTDLFLRRDAVEKVGGFEEGFSKIYQMYEDQAFLTKFYLDFPVYVSGECWDKYRLHPDSCCATVSRSGNYDRVRLYFLTWFENYLNRRGIADSEIRSALDRAFFPYRYPLLSRARKFLGRARRLPDKLRKMVKRR
ncbi:glycosyltransferase family 2 protein [Pannus brasiliensis CCIBt3594]|uniref:Glycosyltransferase family 2 protein n=1 Tax=Pannus brasiliensis CCIBt3594 TaxID=1427578 RepID=A0AAW9QPJ5_9CHRO